MNLRMNLMKLDFFMLSLIFRFDKVLVLIRNDDKFKETINCVFRQSTELDECYSLHLKPIKCFCHIEKCRKY